MSTYSPCSSSSTPSTSSECFTYTPMVFEKCRLCPRTAYSTNYGVLTCDACKMFFRRIVVLNKNYKCKYQNQCDVNYDSRVLQCKSCRFQKCVKAGMSFRPSLKELKNDIDSSMADIIVKLKGSDKRRIENMRTKYTEEDFNIEQIVGIRRMKLRTRNCEMSTHDWSFWGIYTSIEFLMSFDYMENLDKYDKIILLKSFSVKASLLASAMRAKREGSDRLRTVDGKDVYPDVMKQIPLFSVGFLERIRSFLVSKLIDLKVTTEEFVLLNALFFCNSGLPNLSTSGKSFLSSVQRRYTSILLKYCQLTYQHSAPSRFADLISLANVINQNLEDVKTMTVIFKLYDTEFKSKKIVSEVV